MALFKILRGNESNLFNADGTLKKAWTDGYAYYCTDTHDFYIDHLDSSGKQVRSKLNSKEAEKLKTSRSISLGDAVTSTATQFDGTADITIPVNTIKESYLTWGGKAIRSALSPIGAALDSKFSSNKLAFANPAGFKFETSTDSGSTWTERTINNDVVTNIMSSSIDGLILAPEGDTEVLTTSQARITLEASALGVYISPSKMLMEVSIAGHTVFCDIEYKTKADGATWKAFGSYQISGWSGWNDIPLVLNTFGGRSTQLTNCHFIRMTFRVISINTNYKTTKCSLKALRLFAKADWDCNSNLARSGHLYSYDYQQNATFPAKVTATALASTGTLAVTGNSTLTGNLIVNGNTALGNQYSDTILSKGVTTIGDSTRTYATAQFHTLYGNLEMYKGYLYVESADGTSYFAVDGDPNGSYTEVNSMPLKLTGTKATLNVDGTSQFNQTVTIGDTSDSDNTNCLLDVYGQICSNQLHIYGGATVNTDLDISGATTLNTLEVDGLATFLAGASISGDLEIINDGIITLYDADGIKKVEIDSAIRASTGLFVKDYESGFTHTIMNRSQIALRTNDDGSATFQIQMKNDGTIKATTSVTSPEFIGDLTGNADTADEAISLTWVYFDDTGVIS